jgi:PspAA-like protein
MIVRVMGEGQWRVDDALAGRLAELDAETERAVERDDEQALHAALAALVDVVRGGERLDDAHLGSSDAIVPPPDLTLEEARRIIHHDGLIPDLP